MFQEFTFITEGFKMFLSADLVETHQSLDAGKYRQMKETNKLASPKAACE